MGEDHLLNRGYDVREDSARALLLVNPLMEPKSVDHEDRASTTRARVLVWRLRVERDICSGTSGVRALRKSPPLLAAGDPTTEEDPSESVDERRVIVRPLLEELVQRLAHRELERLSVARDVLRRQDKAEALDLLEPRQILWSDKWLLVEIFKVLE